MLLAINEVNVNLSWFDKGEESSYSALWKLWKKIHKL
jgi:hypothetical protein